MRVIKCDHPGCEFVAKHETHYVNCIIARHKSMKHGVRGKLFKYTKAGKAEAEARKSEVQPAAPTQEVAMNIPNYCPNCGCSMRAVTAAMNLRRGR